MTARSAGEGRSPKRSVAGTPGDRVARSVDGVCRSGKAAGDQVAEHRMPNSVPAGRSTGDRHRGRSEERVQGCDRCSVVATVDRLVVPLGRCDSAAAPPASRPRGDGSPRNPASRNTASIRAFSASTSAMNCSMPRPTAMSASCSSRRVPTPCPWSRSATANATSPDCAARSRSSVPTAMISPPAIASRETRPGPSPVRYRATNSWSRCGKPQNRKYRLWVDNPRRKRRRASASAGVACRSLKDVPSRSRTSRMRLGVGFTGTPSQALRRGAAVVRGLAGRPCRRRSSSTPQTTGGNVSDSSSASTGGGAIPNTSLTPGSQIRAVAKTISNAIPHSSSGLDPRLGSRDDSR